MNISKKTITIAILILLIIGSVFTIVQLQNQQEIRQRAQQTQPVCEIRQAKCTWSPATNATVYLLTVRDAGTGTVIKTGSVNAPITEFVFPVEQGRSYTCAVTARNTCGDSNIATSSATLCPGSTPTPTASPSATPTLTIAPTVTPTAAPTATPTITPVPTATPEPTATPIPTAPPVGAPTQAVVPTARPIPPPVEQPGNIATVIIGIGGTLLAILGTLVFLAL